MLDHIEMIESDWEIPPERQAEALLALQELSAKFTLPYVNQLAVAQASTLGQALRACGYQLDEHGMIIAFLRDQPGNDNLIFETLAPFTEPNCIITFREHHSEELFDLTFHRIYLNTENEGFLQWD